MQHNTALQINCLAYDFHAHDPSVGPKLDFPLSIEFSLGFTPARRNWQSPLSFFTGLLTNSRVRLFGLRGAQSHGAVA